jgi:hypothetical protein
MHFVTLEKLACRISPGAMFPAMTNSTTTFLIPGSQFRNGVRQPLTEQLDIYQLQRWYDNYAGALRLRQDNYKQNELLRRWQRY